MKKRILAMFLACMMILSVIAVPAFAAEKCAHENTHYEPYEEPLPETCLEEAIVRLVCDDCGEFVTFVKASGKHNPKTVFTDADCVRPEGYYDECTLCFEKTTEWKPLLDEETNKPGDPAGCKWTRVTRDEYIAAGGTVADGTVEAACGVTGVVFEICDVCGKANAEQKKATYQHNWVVDPEAEGHKEPTCTEAGYYTKVCDNFGCAETKSGAEEAKGHTKGTDKGAVDASCAHPAGIKYECSVCHLDFVISWKDLGAPESAWKDQLAHDFEDYKIEATCTVKGETGKRCKECGYKDPETVKIGNYAHNEVANTDKAPTCSKPGYVGATWCSKCHVEIKPGTKADANPELHNPVFKDWFREAEACGEQGIARMHCEHCGEHMGYLAKKQDHLEYAFETVAPTCCSDGYTVYKCRECTDYSRKDPITKRPDHVYSTTLTEKETPAKCGVDAKMESYYKCTNPECTAKKDHKIETLKGTALEHDLEETITGVKNGAWPTCDKPGLVAKACTRKGCTYKETAKVVEALGHKKSGESTYVAETCEKPNGERWYCSVCETHFNEYYVEGEDIGYIAAKGHKYTISVDAVKATCKADGHTAYKKCACGAKNSEYTVLPKNKDAHVWELAHVYTEPNCGTKENGIGKYVCANGCEGASTYLSIQWKHTWGEELKASESKNALYVECDDCDAVQVYKYLGDLAEGETEADYNGKIVDSLDLDVTVAITGLVDKNVSLTVNVIGLATGANAWVEVNGNVVEMNGTHATYVARVNNIASTFNVVVKVEEYGIVRTSAVSEYKFAQAASVPTVEVKQTTKLENATAKFFSRGVLIGETVKLIYRVEAAETASVVLVNGDTKYTVNLADLKVDADGKYTVEFEIAADEWTTEFAATIVDADGKAISNTNYYSVAQYAQNNVNKVAEAFKAVLLAMMKAAA